MPRITELTVNGAKHPVDADGDRSLLSVLRNDLGLTGCKYGCGEGDCGACTVMIGRVRLGVVRRGAMRRRRRCSSQTVYHGKAQGGVGAAGGI